MESYLGDGARIVDHRSGHSLSRASIIASASARADELRRIGVSAGDRVVIAHPDGVSVIVDLFAIWRLRAVAVIVSPGITAPERENVLATTTAAAWLSPETQANVAWLPPARLEHHGEAGSTSSIRLDEPAIVMMTSGTTARPKGVVLTHRALQARLALNRAHIGDCDLAVTLTVLPIHFGHGLIGNTLTALSAGYMLVAWSEPGPIGLASLGAAIDQHGVTFMSSVPSLWRVAMRLSARPACATLRRVHVGSAPLGAALWADIISWTGTKRVFNMYGITETANWIGGWSGETGQLVDGLVGRPWGGNLRLRQQDGSIVSAGRGEVMVNSPSLMAGYFNSPDLSESVLDGEWFLTGDIGEIDTSGNLRLIGRIKSEINRGGIKIPAEEIDALLELHPDIDEACAFGLADSLSGETVAAAIVLSPTATADTTALLEWCETRIRREAAPSRLFILAALPRTERGKLNRDRVHDACLQAGKEGTD